MNRAKKMPPYEFLTLLKLEIKICSIDAEPKVVFKSKYYHNNNKISKILDMKNYIMLYVLWLFAILLFLSYRMFLIL